MSTSFVHSEQNSKISFITKKTEVFHQSVLSPNLVFERFILNTSVEYKDILSYDITIKSNQTGILELYFGQIEPLFNSFRVFTLTGSEVRLKVQPIPHSSIVQNQLYFQNKFLFSSFSEHKGQIPVSMKAKFTRGGIGGSNLNISITIKTGTYFLPGQLPVDLTQTRLQLEYIPFFTVTFGKSIYFTETSQEINWMLPVTAIQKIAKVSIHTQVTMVGSQGLLDKSTLKISLNEIQSQNVVDRKTGSLTFNLENVKLKEQNNLMILLFGPAVNISFTSIDLSFPVLKTNQTGSGWGFNPLNFIYSSNGSGTPIIGILILILTWGTYFKISRNRIKQSSVIQAPRKR